MPRIEICEMRGVFFLIYGLFPKYPVDMNALMIKAIKED
jgi:hypothetical protein